MRARDADSEGVLAGDGGSANKGPPALGVNRPNLDGWPPGYTPPAT
jgi:hypothetical protein